MRGGGVGQRLIRRAEDEARRRGCTAALVMPVTFRAEFYERHGLIAGLAKSPARRTRADFSR